MEKYQIEQTTNGLKSHLFRQCEKLEMHKISLDEVKGHSDLAKQINNVWKIEIDRDRINKKIQDNK